MSKGCLFAIILFAIIASLAALARTAHVRYRAAMAQLDTAWSDIESRARAAPSTYTPELVSDLPEIGKRYFNHAIAVGTPLFQHAELTMSGTFLLGDRGAQQTYVMHARQILAPPSEFIWIADMAKGPLRISGSDGLHQGRAWTRFWMFRSLPLVQQAATPDLDRAATARPAVEAVWTPAALLPGNGAQWIQTSPDTADVTFGTGASANTISLRVAENGALKEVWTQRWSDVNPDKIYQNQPFGATIKTESLFGGFTIPSQVTVGNHFGTSEFLPFFRAGLTSVRYF